MEIHKTPGSQRTSPRALNSIQTITREPLTSCLAILDNPPEYWSQADILEYTRLVLIRVISELPH